MPIQNPYLVYSLFCIEDTQTSIASSNPIKGDTAFRLMSTRRPNGKKTHNTFPQTPKVANQKSG